MIEYVDGCRNWDTTPDNFSHGCSSPVGWKNLKKVHVGERAIDDWTCVEQAVDINGETITLWASASSQVPYRMGYSYVIDIHRPSSSGLSDHYDSYRIAGPFCEGTLEERCNIAREVFQRIVNGELNSTTLFRQLAIPV